MQNKIELIDEGSYYRAFQQWLDTSNQIFDVRNEDLMNEKWISFSDEIGIKLGSVAANNQILAEILDSSSWKEAKKHYSIISFKTNYDLQTTEH